MSTPTSSESSRLDWRWLVWAAFLLLCVFVTARADRGEWLLPVLLIGLCVPTFLRWRQQPWLLLVAVIPALFILGGKVSIVVGALLMIGLLSTAMFGLGTALVPRISFVRACAGVLAVLLLWLLFVVAVPNTHGPRTPTFSEASKELGESSAQETAPEGPSQ